MSPKTTTTTTTTTITTTSAVGSTTADGDDDRNKTVWENLTSWISQSGNTKSEGCIHSSLELRGDITQRGVYAKKSIPKGDLLVRLPAQCVLSGESMPESYEYHLKGEMQTRKASAWMRCLASLYKAQHEENKNNFKSYLSSLPNEYDTLLNWTDEEIATSLTGTALGRVVQLDRKEQAMRTRYKIAIQPYLQQHNLLSPEESKEDTTKEFDTFQRACMCLSTRGFHLEVVNNDNSESASTSTSYSGPFLLPVIDLLNHDTEQKCTTLQRDPKDQSFYMIAERNIEENEEIFHSYGDTLTSAQLLQTFGFVSPKACIRAQQEGKETFVEPSPSSEQENTKETTSLTPAVLTKDEITKACLALEASQYASEIRRYMEEERKGSSSDEVEDDVEEDEAWIIPANIDKRDMSSLSIADDHHFLISASNPLTDELVTFCSLLIMPDEAYDDFMSNDPALLDDSVLEDFFLGKMICKALLVASSTKLAEYNLSSTSNSDSSTSNNRALYGLAIRREEASSLQKLRNKVIHISDSLDDSDTVDAVQDYTILQDTKRARLN